MVETIRVVIVVAFGVVSVALVAVALNVLRRRTPDSKIDALIRERGVRSDGVRPRYIGFEPRLRAAVTERRHRADIVRQDARRMDCVPVELMSPKKIVLYKGGEFRRSCGE